jgi:adenylyl- and sulfurtransferase ThiI
LLFDRVQRIEVEEGVVRNDAAGGTRTADFTVEGRRVTHQPRTNLEVAEHVGAAVLDAHRFALVQASAAAAVLNPLLLVSVRKNVPSR